MYECRLGRGWLTVVRPSSSPVERGAHYAVDRRGESDRSVAGNNGYFAVEGTTRVAERAMYKYPREREVCSRTRATCR
jgi:hypothetical protein